MYIINNMQRVGSRAQVMHGNAKQTGGGLKKKDLKYNKQGKIVSKKMSTRAKKEKRLQKAGYTTRKGQFGAVRIMKGGVMSPVHYKQLYKALHDEMTTGKYSNLIIPELKSRLVHDINSKDLLELVADVETTHKTEIPMPENIRITYFNDFGELKEVEGERAAPVPQLLPSPAPVQQPSRILVRRTQQPQLQPSPAPVQQPSPAPVQQSSRIPVPRPKRPQKAPSPVPVQQPSRTPVPVPRPKRPPKAPSPAPVQQEWTVINIGDPGHIEVKYRTNRGFFTKWETRYINKFERNTRLNKFSITIKDMTIMTINPPDEHVLVYDQYINRQRFKNRNGGRFKLGTKYRVDLEDNGDIIAELAFIRNSDKEKFLGFHVNGN
jgi:hypothetical protein